MDLSKLAGTLLSSDSLNGLSSLTGTSSSDVTNVLTNALPSLLSGATQQAKDENTAAGFANALAQHAKDDTSNLSGFLGKVDLQDGAKIVSHLLGSGKDETVQRAAKAAGVSEKKTSDILSAVSPMLLSLLGKQAEEDDDKETGANGLVGALLDNVDVGSLLSGLVSTNTSSSSSNNKKKSGGILGGILSGLLKK